MTLRVDVVPQRDGSGNVTGHYMVLIDGADLHGVKVRAGRNGRGVELDVPRRALYRIRAAINGVL